MTDFFPFTVTNEMSKGSSGTDDLTAEHLLQHCRLHDAMRRDTWPDPTLLKDKLYGNLGELRRTAAKSKSGLALNGIPYYGKPRTARCGGSRVRYHGGRRPSSDDSFHSPTVIPPSALDKPSIMKRYHHGQTTR